MAQLAVIIAMCMFMTTRSRWYWSTRKSSGPFASIPKGGQALGREVLEVRGHDHLCAGADGGREDVPIVQIGKLHGRDERLVPGDIGIRESIAHEDTSAGQLDGIEIGPILAQVIEHLIQDLVGPVGADLVADGHPDEQIAQHVRIKHAGVVDNSKGHS